MRRFLRGYGAHPLHLLGLLGCFTLAGYAGRQLMAREPVAVTVWFVGSAVGHDLVLFPLYAVADTALLRVARRVDARRAGTTSLVNHVRVPTALSALLLLVYAPSILQRSRIYTRTTALPADRFIRNWLIVTAALFLVSVVHYFVRARRSRNPHG